MKKRFLLMMLAGVLAFSMIGCGGNEQQEEPTTGDEIVENEDQVQEGENEEAEGEVEEPEVEEPEVEEPAEKPEVEEPEVEEPAEEPEMEEPEVDEPATEGEATVDKAFADMTLEEMIRASYANIELPFTGEMEIDKTDAEAVAFYLGTSDISFKRGVVSEAMISSIAHSVIVLELEDGADAASVAAKLEESAPVDKWVCVVPEQVGTAVKGNVVMLAMSNSADAILANFSALK